VKAWKKLGLALGAFAATLVIGELAVRWTSTPPFDSARAREDALAVVTRMRAGAWGPQDEEAESAPADEDPEYLLHAYFGFDVGGSDATVTHDAETFAKPAAAQRIDVLLLGGSVAAGFAKDARRDLEQKLEALAPWSAGRPVRVLGAARGGFRQPQQLHLLEYLLSLGYRPDIVVELDGFNEVALGLQNARAGVHPIMPSVSHWTHLANTAPLGPLALDAIAWMRNARNDAERLFHRADRAGYFHSAIAARFVQARLDESYARYAEAAQLYDEQRRSGARSYCIGPEFDVSDESAVEISARLWFESSLSMDAICRLWGIRYLHFLQPTLHDEGSKPTTELELSKGAEPKEWALGARLGYPRLRARGAELVARGVEFADLSRTFADVKTDLYYDICHFAPAGNRMLVDRVVEVLTAHPAPPPREQGR
jgi:hypothetical protein